MTYHSLKTAVETICGKNIEVVSRKRVSGGDINQAFLLTLSGGEKLFMKINAAALKDMFLAEQKGLQFIEQTKAIGTPKVYGAGTDDELHCSFLLMEYVESAKKRPDYWERLGLELAAMHKADTAGILATGRYGFVRDNYIGSTPQSNVPMDSWIDFFREQRLEAQIKMADNYLSAADRKAFLHLLENLDRYLVEPERPSLLHGDLWGGNVLCGNDGKAWLIDPAVYIGCNEADLAMTELFGGFAPEFYEAYKEAYEMIPGYEDRRDLYNLYQLLNHVNLFGAGYLSAVRGILHRYV